MSATDSTVTLADLCNLVGVQCSPSEVPDATYLGLEHLAPGRMKSVGYGLAADAQSHKSVFQRDDVLYGKLRPYLDKAVLAEGAGICTTELLVLRPKPCVVPRYLACVVHDAAFVEHAMAGVTGAQHPRTSWSHISTFTLPRHDQDEQRAISQVLWSVHDLVQACERSTEAALRLKHAAMRELFTRGLRGEAQKETEIGMVPEAWTINSLGAHHTVVSGGTPSRSNSDFWNGGSIPWVKTTEVNYSVINESEEHITPAGLDGSAAKLLRPGTLLMAMYGQGVTRGKVAILGIEAACNQACAAITPRDETLLPRYLYHFLTWRYEAIRSLAHGGQQQNLNLEIVRDLLIAYPTLREEQQAVVSILDAIDHKVDLHYRKRVVLEELFRALVHKLMTGAVRVRDLDVGGLGVAASGGVS